ncbi:hypothetical protein [Paenibacillus spiritus]|nr:hypothetical protein [Paenibacillus spiritus]
MIELNNLNVTNIDYDGDYVFIQKGKEAIQISRVLLSRINVMLSDDEE